MNPATPPTPSTITRRQALRLFGAGAAFAWLAARLPAQKKSAPPVGADGSIIPLSPWDLPPLPFAYDALEPHIDALTMQIHHSKHHQAYITNAKRLLESFPDWRNRPPEFLLRNLEHLPEAIRQGVRNHVGGHVNHTFFWSILARTPDHVPVNTIAAAINDQFGSFDKFKQQFTDVALKRFGSGWAWLVVRDRTLQIISTANQDSPLSEGYTPLLALDVWEHAYYLNYQDRRPEYVEAFWNVVNWPRIDTLYQATL